MTDKKFKKYYPLIEVLAKKRISKDQFSSMIHSLNDPAVEFICECCKNAISKSYFLQMSNKNRKLLYKKVGPSSKIIKNYAKSEKVIRKLVKSFDKKVTGLFYLFCQLYYLLFLQ